MNVKHLPIRKSRVEHVLFLLLLTMSFSINFCMADDGIDSAEKNHSCKALRAMARVYMACGNYSKAQPLAEKALDLARKTEASDAELSSFCIDLAYLYKNQGRMTDAEKLCQQCLQLQKNTYSDNHPYVAHTLRILGEIYREQARYQEAAAVLEQAISIIGQNDPKGDRTLAPFKVDMGRLLTAQGSLAPAESLFTDAMRTIESEYGPDHLYTSNVNCSIAELYIAQGRYAEAKVLIQKSLAVQKKVYGPDHYCLVPVLLAMSKVYQFEGDYTNAKMSLQKCLSLAEKQAGPNHQLVGDILSCSGQVHIACKEYDKAEKALQRAVKILENSLGQKNDRTGIAFHNLARLYIQQGKYPQARDLCQRALDIFETVFDSHHSKVVEVLETMAQLYYKTDNNVEARKLEERIAKIRAAKQVAFGPIAREVE